MSYLRYLCLLAHSGVQHILCCVFGLFFVVLCTLCCQFLWIFDCLSVFSNVSFSGLYKKKGSNRKNINLWFLFS